MSVLKGVPLKKSERIFRDGDVIFRESDSSESVFVVVKGNVELTKSGDNGPVMLAILGAGEVFGEMGILDRGLRSASAHAVGDTVLEETSRRDFLTAIKNEPEMAVAIMAKLVERLRRANDMLAHPTTVEKPGKPVSRISMFGMLKSIITSAGGAGADRIDIRVAGISGEIKEAAGQQTRHIIASLGKRKGIRVRPQGKMPEVDFDLHPDDRARIYAENARKSLLASGDDVMIWGDIPPPGTTLYLHFVSATPDEEDRPGCFLATTTLTLPVDFGAEFSELLLAVTLAATAPANESKRIRLAQALSETLYAAMPAVQNLPLDLTNRERAAIQLCYGNAVATMCLQRGTGELYQVAAQTFRGALVQLSVEDSQGDWALAQMHLGSILQTIGERGGETDILSGAIEAFDNALKFFSRATHPVQWASMQNRLGLVLYKLDMNTGDTEMLKHALTTFQAALQVFNRSEYPLRWAEVMNNFAQAAQVLGDQLRNVEVLQKAVDACRGALEVRRRETGPMLWAATQNNLGSALFLLGRMTEEETDLHDAVEAFSEAGQVYRTHGAGRLASVADKNLARARDLLDELEGQKPSRRSEIPALHWEKE